MLKHAYIKIMLTVIAICLLFISYKVYQFSILDNIPTITEIKQLDEVELEKLRTIFWIIGKGVDFASPLKVEVEGGYVDVSGAVDCTIVE